MTDCAFCQRTPPDPSYASPRECAFTTGVFSTQNWQCESMNLLRSLAEKNRVYGEDESAAVIFTDTFVLLHWYKNRGRTTSCLIFTNRGVWRPPTVEEIDRMILGSQDARPSYPGEFDDR